MGYEYFIWMVVAWIVSYAITPRPKGPDDAARQSFDEIDFPRAEEGTPQAVTFGECWTPDWCVLAVGDYRTTSIVKRGGGKK